jgi:hypothetical protein
MLPKLNPAEADTFERLLVKIGWGIKRSPHSYGKAGRDCTLIKCDILQGGSRTFVVDTAEGDQPVVEQPEPEQMPKRKK